MTPTDGPARSTRPTTLEVYRVYRPGQPVEMLENPDTLVGDDSVLPGFVLPVRELW